MICLRWRDWSNISTWKFVENQLMWWYLHHAPAYLLFLNATSFQALKGPRAPHSSDLKHCRSFVKDHSRQQIGGGFKPPTGGDDPFWQIFFRWVETTNQAKIEMKTWSETWSLFDLGISRCVFEESIAPQRRCHYRVNLTSVRLLGAVLKIYLVP